MVRLSGFGFKRRRERESVCAPLCNGTEGLCWRLLVRISKADNRLDTGAHTAGLGGGLDVKILGV